MPSRVTKNRRVDGSKVYLSQRQKEGSYVKKKKKTFLHKKSGRRRDLLSKGELNRRGVEKDANQGS